MAAKKSAVCIHIFPSLDYIELIQLDDKEGGIEHASSLPASFDLTNRQMDSVEQMTQVIKDLFDTNRIPTNTPTVLVLPSFFTREIELPTEFTNDELRMTLLSEAERFYIFKKNEPEVDWLKLSENTLLYAAFQRSEIEKYIQAFQSNGIPLTAIDLNYTSILRGLISTGAISDQIEGDEKWCMLVVTDFAFFACICQGVMIQKTLEAPLSVAAEDMMGTITEVQQDFERFTGLEILEKLVLVNNSTRIPTDTLMSHIGFSGPVVMIEQNGATLRSRGISNAPFPCSLEAIGGALYKKFPELPAMDFKPSDGEDVIALMNYRQLALKGLLIANGAALILCLAVWGLVSLMTFMKRSELDQLTQSISSYEQGNKVADVQQKLFIKKAVEKNVKANDLIVKVGAVMPTDTWLTKVILDNTGPEETPVTEIQGGALFPDPVNQLNNDLKRQLSWSDLDVANLNMTNADDGQTYYNWAIKSKSLVSANAPAGSPAGPQQR